MANLLQALLALAAVEVGYIKLEVVGSFVTTRLRYRLEIVVVHSDLRPLNGTVGHAIGYIFA